MNGKSLDITQEKLNKLKELIPEVFTEGDKLDVEKLRLTLGEDIELSNERYVLNWAGKSEAFKVLQTPTTATLAPDKAESVNFDTTENIFIEGENLEVLKVLQKSYYGKIKMIYIDPPYNTGNDSFIYPDRFSESKEEYLKRIGEKDEEGYLLKEGMFRKNSKENGQYHSNWLNMMYPRLFLARNLLSEDGVIFVSIDDNEVHNLRMIMNEMFGEENVLAELIWNLRSGTQAGHFTRSHEYILCYARNKAMLDFFIDPNGGIIKHGALKKISSDNPESEITFPKGIEFEGRDAEFKGELGGSEKQTIVSDRMIFKNGKLFEPVKIRAGWAMRDQILSWLEGKETFDTKGQRVNRFFFNSQGILWYEKERETIHPKTVLPDSVGNTKSGSEEIISLFGFKVIDFPKPSSLIKYIIDIACINDDVILDFFAGSGTTAHSVFNSFNNNRKYKFILIQLDENISEENETYKAGYKTISDVCKERIRKVIQLIEDEKKNSPQLFVDKELDLGFKVFKLKYSNFKLWRGDVIENGDDLTKQIDVFENPVREGTEETNILYELILKSGYELTIKIEKKDDLYLIADNEFIIALTKIDENIIDQILQIRPKKCIVLDKLFNGIDQLKTNTVLQMKDAGIEFKTV